MIKLFVQFFLISIFLISSVSNALPESEYTHERSEKLYHLIQWHEYSPATFKKALEEQKPIYVVLSAPAWCYWCHVYESEDYLYHPDLYPFINEHFIAIFIDSDKRPDLTMKYLEGGWPSTVILAPDLRRISGFSGPGDPGALRDFLERIIDFLKDKSFNEMSAELRYEEREPLIPEKGHLLEVKEILLFYAKENYDEEYGGFLPVRVPGRSSEQKFPAGFIQKVLLEEYDETGNKEYLNIVQTTFNNQYTEFSELETGYRLYDPVEGGFHRYSTKRDWSVPHYEKMLGDQAKMVNAYAHLLKITGNNKVRDAVEGTISYVIKRLYDEEGGFYSSQDAYLEHEYYGLTEEERDKIKPPFIDRTRNMDSNSMMVSALLYMHEFSGDRKYKDAAVKTLNFLKQKMIGKEGAYYYFDYEKKKPYLTGQSISNSWAIMAFLDGYKYLREKRYLKVAGNIAEYSLKNLYDWNSGGFFERNSKDEGLYAPGEHISLFKPYRENAVFSYAMLRLYLITGELEYLESGLKTLGYLLGRSGNPDDAYYAVKASELADKNALLDRYKINQEEITSLIDKNKADFFLTALLEKTEEDHSFDEVPGPKDEFFDAGFIVLALLAFFAGVLSFLSPCTLPVLPAYFAQGFGTGKGAVLKNTVFFFLGLATVFSLFGMGATFIGSIFRENRTIFSQVAAVIIITFGVLEIFGKGFSGLNINLKGDRKTPVGSYLFGSVFAIGWSACIGPILASLLLLSAASVTALKGSALLFVYASGLAMPLIIVSLFFDRIRSKKFWNVLKGKAINFKVFKKDIMIHSTYLISGLILIILGILIFNGYLYKLNRIALQADYVQEIIIKGEEYLKNILVR